MLPEEYKHDWHYGEIFVFNNGHYVILISRKHAHESRENSNRRKNPVPQLRNDYRRNGNRKKNQNLKNVALPDHFPVQHICQKQSQWYLSENRYENDHHIVPQSDEKHRVMEHSYVIIEADETHFPVTAPLGETQNEAEKQRENNYRNKNYKSREHEGKIAEPLL
jgi:hypothetical protein